MVVFPSDHMINKNKEFANLIKESEPLLRILLLPSAFSLTVRIQDMAILCLEEEKKMVIL